MEISGLIDELKDRHREIAFDRPGYGYSERPRDTILTPEELFHAEHKGILVV